ncbi:MAG: hypothetical protein LKI53_04930 [Bacteroidales bacterium]|jgi:hypothetical protein|nr:hypothetical protein [Bacteroidales bacterium]
MKKFLTILAMVFISLQAFAQNNYLFPAKGKTLVYKVSVTSPEGNKTTYSTTSVSSKNADSVIVVSKGFSDEQLSNQVSEQKIKYSVENGLYVTYIADAIKNNLSQMTNMKISGDKGRTVYPVSLKAGEKIPGTSIEIIGDMMGQSVTLNVDSKGFVFVDESGVKVPYGSYDCIKGVQEVETSIMGMNQKTINTMYYVPGIGVVKQTSDIMSGQVTMVSELIDVR